MGLAIKCAVEQRLYLTEPTQYSNVLPVATKSQITSDNPVNGPSSIAPYSFL